MRRLICAVFIVLVAMVALAGYGQSANGSVTGIISSGANGAALSGAGVQAKNVATNAFARTVSKSDGGYTLMNLPPGTYEISVNMPCCAFQSYVKSDVVVSARAAV